MTHPIHLIGLTDQSLPQKGVRDNVLFEINHFHVEIDLISSPGNGCAAEPRTPRPLLFGLFSGAGVKHVSRPPRPCRADLHLSFCEGHLHPSVRGAYLLVYILHLSLGLAPQGPRYERNLRSGPDPLR